MEIESRKESLESCDEGRVASSKVNIHGCGWEMETLEKRQRVQISTVKYWDFRGDCAHTLVHTIFCYAAPT